MIKLTPFLIGRWIEINILINITVRMALLLLELRQYIPCTNILKLLEIVQCL